MTTDSIVEEILLVNRHSLVEITSIAVFDGGEVVCRISFCAHNEAFFVRDEKTELLRKNHGNLMIYPRNAASLIIKNGHQLSLSLYKMVLRRALIIPILLPGTRSFFKLNHSRQDIINKATVVGKKVIAAFVHF